MPLTHYPTHGPGGPTDNMRPRANTADNFHRYRPTQAVSEAYYSSVLDTGTSRQPSAPVPINFSLHRSKTVSHHHNPRDLYNESSLKNEAPLTRSDAKSYRSTHRPQVAGIDYYNCDAPEKTDLRRSGAKAYRNSHPPQVDGVDYISPDTPTDGLTRSNAKHYRNTHRPQVNGVDYINPDTRTDGLARSDGKAYRNTHRPQISGLEYVNPHSNSKDLHRSDAKCYKKAHPPQVTGVEYTNRDAPEKTDLRRVPAFQDRANTRNRPRGHRLNEPFDAPAFVESPGHLDSPFRMPAPIPSGSETSRRYPSYSEDQSRSNTPLHMLRAPPRPDSLGIKPRYGNIENAKSSASGSTKRAASVKLNRQASQKVPAPTGQPKYNEISKFKEMMDVTLDAPYRRDAPPARPHPPGMPYVGQRPGESDADWDARCRKEEREWYAGHPYGSLLALRLSPISGRLEPQLVPKKYPDPPYQPWGGFLGSLGRCVGVERPQKLCNESAW